MTKRGRNKNLTEYVKIKRKIKIFKYTKKCFKMEIKVKIKIKNKRSNCYRLLKMLVACKIKNCKRTSKSPNKKCATIL